MGVTNSSNSLAQVCTAVCLPVTVCLQMLGKRLQIIGSTMRARPKEYKEKIVREFAQFAGNKFETGELKPIIDKTFKLSEAKEAHQYMEAKKNKGKIVLIVREQ